MSEFHELIKSFAKSREYVRDFFVYGFKTRDEFGGWSGRTYDNERRRLESWLSGYVRQEYTGSGTAKGKNIYLTATFSTPTRCIGYGKPKVSRTTISCCISIS